VTEESQVVAQLLEAGLADWVSLHDVVWFGTDGARDSEAKARVLDVLRQLFDDGLMIPGDLSEEGFETWSSPRTGWVSRAESDLDRLRWRPMGAGFWLRITELGLQAAGPKQPPGGSSHM
jgi:hypothetical protein